MNLSIYLELLKILKKTRNKLYFYSLFFNSTLVSESLIENFTETMMHDNNFLRLKQSIDNGILSYLSQNTMQTPEINIPSSHYPTPVDRFVQGANVSAFMGSYWFNLPCMVTFLAMVIFVIQEKELKLRQGLNVIGVSHKLYWTHWILTGWFLSFTSTLTQITMGVIFRIEFFYNVNFIILFTMFFMYNQWLCFTAFALCTISPSRTFAYTVCYAVILAAILFQFTFSIDSLVLFLFFSEITTPAVVIIRTFFFLFYPPFTYSILFMQIMRVGTRHFNSNYQAFIEGKFFTWSDLIFEERDVIVNGIEYHVSSALSSFGYLLFNLCFYIFLTWYFDHVFSNNRGVKYSKIFCWKSAYWKKLWKRNINPQAYRRYSSTEELNEIEEKVDGEDNVAINVQGLSKTYRIWACKRECRQLWTAVKTTHLKIYEKELFCILGHNGAGKSTLINMLIGILPPSKNTASLLGFDILTDIEDARQYIGVVPQFNILWEDLTVYQNMEIFWRLKNTNPNSTISSKLKAVNLTDSATLPVKKLSGGMKRRLSLAMSLIGNPKIIFMDEPTSGMDPVIRRQVWKVIRDIKKTSTIVLTTHSMEEADVLSDRIGIMVDGTFKVVDTSLSLKNRFSEGYKLNLITTTEKIDEVRNLITEIIPNSIILSEKGGSLILTLKSEDLKALIKDPENKEFLYLLQKDRIKFKYSNDKIQILSKHIINFGISQSTLEEVFTIVNK